MEITLTTPALLFPAISLLLVAYSSRFLAIGSRIRALHQEHRSNGDRAILSQIGNLRQRILLIKNMQALGVASLFSCVFCMFLLFAGEILLGKIVFGISLLLLMASLALSLKEIMISVEALNLVLKNMEKG